MYKWQQQTCRERAHACRRSRCQLWTACAFAAEGSKPFSKGAYALGKIVWGKGWEELLALLSQDKEARQEVLSVPIDCYGAGEAASAVHNAAHPCFCTAHTACLT